MGGYVVFYSAMTSFTMAISFGGLMLDWASGGEIALWVVSGVLWINFAILTWRPVFVDHSRRLYPAEMIGRPHIQNLQIQLFMGSGVLMVR